MSQTHQGGCFCGRHRYTFDDGDYVTANCHCSMCRRISGAPYVSWVVVPKSRFRFEGPEPKRLRSSEGGTRLFCSNCGTPLACELDKQPEDIDITIGTLDEPERWPPRYEVHDDTKLAWLGTTLSET